MATETILVVDDSKEIRNFICKSILGPSGFRVLTARDGNAGLETAIQHCPDLILMDLNMPGKSGLEVLYHLKQRGVDIPAIVMTSYGSEENILQSLRLGAKDFLQKPFSVEDALAAITNALSETRWQRERAQMTQALADANLKLQMQLKAWANLNLIGQAITSTLEETDVQRRLMWGVNKLMAVEAGSLYLIDEKTGELVLQLSLRGEMENKGGLRLLPGQGIAGWVAQNQQAALVPDVHCDERFYSQVDMKTGFVTRSVLAAPLTAKGKVLGVIQVINPTGTKTYFDQADQELLEALAASVAVAVENARLYAKMRQSVTIETLKQTVVTLSHYINNSLTVLLIVAHALYKGAQNGELAIRPNRVKEAAQTVKSETTRITTIISVLNKVTSPRKTVYQGETQMIDIEKELCLALGETKGGANGKV